ncbi:serine hydrolase domain-containing protein [Pseudoalteromonas sp. NC201]|uniref:serine hydrolase domain-containing protein n=1 Tax=Pseudoalteromonas sp. NC201 TaxID=1514074 RepID=UPI000C7C4657|nr:serine hydrolase [Pseudoalteromonas sp. NC201]AUJ69189.1 Penicillin-binding protein 4* [Pseudoalteromonas sp. NC201]
MKYQLSILAMLAAWLLPQQSQANSHKIEHIASNLYPHVRIITEQYQPHSIMTSMTKHKLPGLSVAVIKNGQIVWAKGYGIANKETNTPVTTNTLFQAASISKPIAALAILHLAQLGKVDLDTDVNTYLRSWKVPKSEFGIITLRHLLSHTSGLTTASFRGYARGEALPTDVDILNGKGNSTAVTATLPAGQQFQYSGGGYMVLEVLLQDVTGKSFAEYVDKTVLTSLGMTQSTFAQPLPKSRWHEASAAFNFEGKQYQGDWFNQPEQAAAGLWTTPTDLAKYVIAVQKAKQGTTTGIITPSLVKDMLTMHHKDMGLGPQLRKSKQGLIFAHSGKNFGYSNRFNAYADKADGMIVMTNGDSARPVVAELQNAINDHFAWDLSSPMLVTPFNMSDTLRNDLIGEYVWEHDKTFKMHIVRKEGAFEIHNLVEGGKFKFIAEAQDSLVAINTGVKVQVETDKKGKVTAIIWAQRHRLIKAG